MTPDREASARLPEQETPAVPGRIHGLRGWSLYEEGPFRRLGSRTRAMIWPPNDNMVAACLGSEYSAAHPAPAPGCHCGIHAHHPFGAGVEVLAESLATPESGFANGIGWTVYGVISAWGRVEVHADGFRAERARPVALLIARNWHDTTYGRAIEETAAEYVLPVIIVEPDPKAIAAACAERWPGLAPALVDELLLSVR